MINWRNREELEDLPLPPRHGRVACTVYRRSDRSALATSIAGTLSLRCLCIESDADKFDLPMLGFSSIKSCQFFSLRRTIPILFADRPKPIPSVCLARLDDTLSKIDAEVTRSASTTEMNYRGASVWINAGRLLADFNGYVTRTHMHTRTQIRDV